MTDVFIELTDLKNRDCYAKASEIVSIDIGVQGYTQIAFKGSEYKQTILVLELPHRVMELINGVN